MNHMKILLKYFLIAGMSFSTSAEINFNRDIRPIQSFLYRLSRRCKESRRFKPYH